MRIFLFITLVSGLLILTNVLSFSQQQKISIYVKVDTIPPNSTVHMTGNTDELGNWIIMQPMKIISRNEWSFVIKAEKGDTLQMKFNRGNWDTEAVDSNGIEFPNFSYIVKRDTNLHYRIPGWRDLIKQKIIITPQRLANKAGFLELIEGWKYQIGDDSSWKDPSFDDSNWKTINPLLTEENFYKLKWTGNIWFRNHIYVDSALWNKTFGFLFVNTGAAEVYLNGKLIYTFGKVGHSKETETVLIDRNPKHILFNGQAEQVLAVRYSNHRAEEMFAYNIPAGFSADLGDLNIYIPNRVSTIRNNSIYQLAFGAFVLAFAIMHFLLYIFYPKAKGNLYYSICMLAFAGVVYTGMEGAFITSMVDAITVFLINTLSIQLSMLFGLLTVYYSTFNKIPKRFTFFLIISGFFILQTVFFPFLGGKFLDYTFYIYIIIVSVEIVSVVIHSAKNKDSNSLGWLIGIGFLLAMFFIVYQVLIMANVITHPLFGIRLVYVYGIILLAITVSINLSKKVSEANSDLERQLTQIKELSQKSIEQERKAKEEELSRKLLEADNKRKTEELEEARKLQLSMLPTKIPSLPNLDIAVYMKPATEVGGDYYDFKYNENGTLIIAVGDATGHGMKAGTMVATIKGLFTAEGLEQEPVSFLSKSNSVIRDMHLGNIFMAMLLAKIEGDRVSISSAGMPPVLIYRNDKKIVEEFRLQALPLGGASEFKYQHKSTTIQPGDTLLLMSDGFPELFNPQKELLDYEKTKELFRTYAHLNPNAIIENLCEEADKWRDGAKQEDDITFVVVKVR
ncbi:MAG: SpoIIE family protein phosphatase [Ignavibacteriaceae bacterium]|nr:SpoIIE family protein phosphatase [Ignavibacteriaceae bacterium]